MSSFAYLPPPPPPSTTPAIEVRNLHYRFPDGTAALRGVDFTIFQGECVGLVGPNGAGKSTLLLHLNGLLPEQFNKDGAVVIEGRVLGSEILHEIRRKVGLVFQDPNDQLFCPTVFEDVAFGPRQMGLGEADIRRGVEQALADVGLSGFEKRQPHHLSAGEKRRVCIAGVLACRPSILILDEPTADLDPRGRRELKRLLRQIPMTKIIATHDLDMVVELCPRTLVLAEGRVAAHGATADLLGDETLMLQYGLERPHTLQHRHPHGFQ